MDVFEKLGDLINKKISEEENASELQNAAADTKPETKKTLGDVTTAAFLFNNSKKSQNQNVGEVVKNYEEDVPVRIVREEK